MIISVPISGTFRTLAPVFFFGYAIHHDFSAWTFIKSGKISSHHEEVGTHSKRHSNMTIMDYTSIRTNRNINTCFSEIFISSFNYFSQSCCLTPSNSLLFTGYTYGAASNSNFYKIRSSTYQVEKSLTIHDISSSDFNCIAIGVF